MDSWNKLRNYEVSVWTLQDNYITTLKSGDPISVYNTATPAAEWPQARAQGQIQNGKITLNIDGTQNLSFDIPMYLFINGKTVENPNWYSAINENILVSMRKIKVIFNKWENVDNIKARSASTFEFLITKVQEEHDSNNALVCHVECEGLAFHELGKVGYKRSLSTDQFNEEYYEWSITNDDDYTAPATKAAAEPMATISYWMESKTNGANIERVPKIDGEIDYDALNPTQWYYDVQMAHSSLVHENEVLSDKIYEEGFPVDWTDSETPINFIETREMTRLIEIKESNLYNITQDLAEKFQVFCRYQYIYDTNYNIIGRLIIFYNNFIKEDEGMPTLLYPSSVSRVEREMDSTDISTKMFVRSVDADDIYTGSINIMDSSANRTREDYVMNFNYLYDIGTISDEQYNAIPEYEAAIRELNDKLTPLQNADGELNKTKQEVDAKIKVLENSIELDEERITENAAHITAITSADGEADGYVTIPFSNPDVLYLMKDETDPKYSSYYVQFNQNGKAGIDRTSVELYSKFSQTSTSETEYFVGFTVPMPNNSNNVTAADVITYNTIIRLSAKAEYMGTIGQNPTVTKLPKEPNDGDYYQTLIKNYPSGYTITVGNYLQYNGDKKTWEVKAQNELSNGTDKGTIGKQPTVTSLPEANADREGMIYLCLQDGIPSGATEGDIYCCSKGYNNNTGRFNDTIAWHKMDRPNKTEQYSYRNKGFFIGTITTTHQPNGLDRKSRTFTRIGYSSSVTEDYLQSASQVFYVTKSNTAPSKPNVKSEDTKATEIKTGNVFDAWTSYKPIPDDYTATSDYKYYTSWKCKIGSNISYTDVTNNTKEAGSTVQTTVTAAKNRFLHESTQIYGTMVDDEYGNLDKIKGLYRGFKNTETTTYQVYSASELWTSSSIPSLLSTSIMDSNNDSITNDDLNNDGDTTSGKLVEESIKKPSKLSNQYLLTHTTKTDTGGNVYSTYKFTYYGADGKAATSPLDANKKKTRIKKAMPVFYLKDTHNPSTPSGTISNKLKTETWTWAQPKPTSNDASKYYMSIQKTFFDGHKTYTNPVQITLQPLPTSSDKVPNYIYAIYKYKPDLYYENIKQFWMDKLEEDTQAKEYQETRQNNIDTCISTIEDQIDELLDEKDKTIKGFERMMGAALRESYWQPENEYQDYGKKYQEEMQLIDTINAINNGLVYDTAFVINTYNNFASIVWDEILFDEEQNNYYETSTAQDKEYYLCIDLTKVTTNLNSRDTNSFLKLFRKYGQKDATAQDYNPFCFFFNPSTDTIPASDNSNDIRYLKYYVIGSEAKLGFVRKGNEIIPVLLLIGASGLSSEELTHLKATAHLGQLVHGISSKGSGEDAMNHVILKYNKKRTFKITNDMWLNEGNNKYKMVYPRIYIPSLKLKNNDKDLVLKMQYHNYNDESRVKTLTKFEDFSVLTKTYYLLNSSDPQNETKYSLYNKIEDVEDWTDAAAKISNGYVISIKPEVLFKYAPVEGKDNGVIAKFKINYAISNADIDIYIDSLNILKENAYPKVSYSLDVSPWSRDLLPKIYQRLAQIVKVNDYDLKLQNTFGYISQVELNLDNEEQDSIEIKNYKTKFEDLFSKIVAETEEMHKNSRNIGLAGSLAEGASVSSTLTPEAFNETIQDTSIQDTLIDFLNKYFDGPNVVQEHIQKMWNEAGDILGAAASGLVNVMNLTSENASILAGFRENVSAALTPSVYTGPVPPSVFKPGDVWMYGGDRAVATGYGGEDGGGFIKTYNGKLAEIVGANVEIDANAGTVKITGETEISLESGKDINIAAGDTVNIIGNKEVNIGGTTINIAALHIKDEDDTLGGIHLISTELSGEDEDSATSRVDLHGEGIELASRKGIVIKSGAGIDIKSSDDVNVSVVSIDKEKGIYIGTGIEASELENRLQNDPDYTLPVLRFYSGIFDINDNENQIAGASAELSKDHLLLGMANVGQAGATSLEMTTGQILLAAGNNLDKLPKDAETGELIINDIIQPQIGTDNSSYYISGIQIQPTYIGMATGAAANRSIVSIKPNLVQLGQMTLKPNMDASQPESYGGSYLWLSNSEVYIGGMGNFTLNTNNIKIQTKLLTSPTANSTDNENSQSAATMGFALGKNLQAVAQNQNQAASNLDANKQQIGLGFWIDTSNNKHLVVDGVIRARGFHLLDDGAYSITSSYALSTSCTDIPADNLFSTTYPNAATITTFYNNNSTSEIYIWTKVTISVGGQQKPASYSCKHIDKNGNETNIIVDYTVNSSASVPSSPTWYSTIDTAKTHLSTAICFLVTRTRTFMGHTFNTTYTFSKMVDDNQPYVKSIKTLYYMKQANSNGSAPSNPNLPSPNPNAPITDNTTGKNKWTLIIPEYLGNKTTKYYYFTCTQTEWEHNPSNTDKWRWDDLKLDYGLSTVQQYATEASLNASAAATATEPITAYGLIGKDDTSYGDLDSNGYPRWNNTSYGLILGNKTELPMLIGSNGGITICDTNFKSGTAGNGSAVVLDSSGIALHGTTINLTTTSVWGTDTITMNSSGITLAGSSITLQSGGQLIVDVPVTDNNGTKTHWFYINTNNLKTRPNTSPYAAFMIYKGSAWSTADYGMRFDITEGFQLKVQNLSVAANGTIDLSAAESINLNLSKALPTGITMLAGTVNIDADTSNYVHISSTNGIEIKGSRIKINDEYIWDHDNIIILKKSGATGYQSQKQIEKSMSDNNVHDWVLIKPYYNTKFTYKWTTVYNFQDNVSNIFVPTTTDSDPYFGNITGGTPYHYTLKCEAFIPGTQYITITLQSYKSDDDKIDLLITQSNCTISGGDASITSDQISTATDSTQTFTLKLNGSTSNLCQEGYTLRIIISAHNVAGATTKTSIKNLNLTCAADSTSGRVPCTVYYYP